VNAAKALLLLKDVNCNTQQAIIINFNEHFANKDFFSFETDFESLVFQINQNEPGKEFAENYLYDAKDFLSKAKSYRESEVIHELKTN
jgi:sulfite reductase (ferredoxin)